MRITLAAWARATWAALQAQAAQVGWSLSLDAQTHRYVLASEQGTAHLTTLAALRSALDHLEQHGALPAWCWVWRADGQPDAQPEQLGLWDEQ